MTEIARQTEDRSFRARLAGRLFGVRWPLAALAVCLLAAWGFGGLSAAIAAIVFAAVFATAALAPRRAIGTVEPDAEDESGKRLESISVADLAAAVPDAILIFDGEGATLHANDPAVTAFGAFTLGLPLQRRFRAPEMQQLIEDMLSGQTEASVVDYVERVPIERVFRVTGTRIRADGALFVLVFKDQSEARRIDRMRADFIANASHELRTPLASITGFVEALRGPARNDAAARESFLKIMQEQTGRMARLIDDLLSLSRLEMKPFLPVGVEVDIREAIDSVIDSLGPLAREAGVEIVREFPAGPVIVAGSRDELFQVFENLLENACKYGQSGGKVVVSIAPPEASAEGETSVTFRDFGPGIAAEHIPRITERFYRVDKARSRELGGTGLGLAIVKHLVLAHGGDLTIESEEGRGTTVRVLLPSATFVTPAS
jgi:two-component system phosphate regulon sensor histidine kinase PhoR